MTEDRNETSRAAAPAPFPVAGIEAEGGFVPRCPRCDYILVGLTVERCPECGRRFSLAQLRKMHLRRKPTPWEDAAKRGALVGRYLKTWRAMLRPPFFLFLARPTSARRAIAFAVITCLLTTAWCALVTWVDASRGWYSVLKYVGLFPPGAAIFAAGSLPPAVARPAYMVGLLTVVLFVPLTMFLWAMLARIALRVHARPAASQLQQSARHQVIAYLSCWLLAGVAIAAAGILAMMPDLMEALFVPFDWGLLALGLLEMLFVTVWCCHADSAVRDGLELQSRAAGPMLVLFGGAAAIFAAGLLASLLAAAIKGML